MRKEKKIIKSLTEQDKQFIKLMNNYAIGLCITKNQLYINELCEVIKNQNERSCKK